MRTTAKVRITTAPSLGTTALRSEPLLEPVLVEVGFVKNADVELDEVDDDDALPPEVDFVAVTVSLVLLVPVAVGGAVASAPTPVSATVVVGYKQK